MVASHINKSPYFIGLDLENQDGQIFYLVH